MYFIASSFSEWSHMRQTGSDEIDNPRRRADDSLDFAAQSRMRRAIHADVGQLAVCAAGLDERLDRAGAERVESRDRHPAACAPPQTIRPGRARRRHHGESAKGGYLSVTSRNAYAITRFSQRMTPSTKSNRRLGYRPVNRMANQAMITATIAAIHKKTSTM